MKKRRLLGILLSLALMLTMMPALAFAEDAPDAEKVETQEVASERDSTVENAEAQDAAAEDSPDAPKKEKEEQNVVKTEEVSAQGDPITPPENAVHLWVGGKAVEDGYSGEIQGACTSGSASVAFDEKGDATLTLDNAQIGDGTPVDSFFANIHSDGINLTIVLNRNNTVGNTTSPMDMGIYVSKGGLTIEGTGTLGVYSERDAISTDRNNNLNIKGGTVTATVLKGDYCDAIYSNNVTIGKNVTAVTAIINCIEDARYACRGIYARGSLAIEGGAVTATINDGCRYSNAIRGGRGVTITGDTTRVRATVKCTDGANDCVAIYSNNANMEIKGGTVDARVGRENDERFTGGMALFSFNNLLITGGTVTATVGEGGDRDSDAIFALDDIKINGANTKVVATEVLGNAISGNNIAIEKGACVDATTNGDVALFAYYGDIKIDNSKVKATAKGAGSAALYSDDSDVIIDGSEVKALTNMGEAINAKNVTLKNSKVSADGEYAVLGENNIDIIDSKLENLKGYIDALNVLKIRDSIVTTEALTYALVGEEGVEVEYTGGGKYETYIEATAKEAGKNSSSTGDADKENIAVLAKLSNLKIEGNLAVFEPKGGAVGNYKNLYATIMNNGKPAAHVIIKVPMPLPKVSTTAKTSKRTTTVKWSWDKATDATSYKLAYRKVGNNEWKVKNTKKTKYVIKRQKLKGLYEYKVAAVTSDGDVWSDVSCRYFKGVQARARVSKGAIKVKWKKDKGATGYEILIAKNKKMNDAQVIQVAPTAKSYKVTGLEKGKYYVKVRPVKEYNGVTYTGVLCKARKVRIK